MGNLKTRAVYFLPVPPLETPGWKTVALHVLGLDSLQKASTRAASLNRRKTSLKTCKVIPSGTFCEEQQGDKSRGAGSGIRQRKVSSQDVIAVNEDNNCIFFIRRQKEQSHVNRHSDTSCAELTQHLNRKN